MGWMHILGYRSRGDFEPQPRQLRLDPPLTPNSVLHGHPPDQGAQFGRNRAAVVSQSWLRIGSGVISGLNKEAKSGG
jgi:hypothetical protein